MSGRNRGSAVPMEGASHGGMPPPVHEPPPFARGHGLVHPHPSLLQDMREPSYRMAALTPHHPAIIEERLAVQNDEIQGLLVDNERLAITHVALKQDLEVMQFELQRTRNYADSLHAEKDIQMRELYDKSVKMEMDLHEVDATRTELMHVNADIKELTAVRQELTAQTQAMSADLTRMTADLQQVPAIRAEIEGLKKELQQARAAVEYEKRGYAENYEHGKLMEQKLVSMTRELDMLRAEMANEQKRARAAASMSNPGRGYNANFGNAEINYAGNPYPANYGANPMIPTNRMHPMQAGTGAYPPYGPGPGAWGTHDLHRAQGPR